MAKQEMFKGYTKEEELSVREKIIRLMKNTDMTDMDLVENLPLFVNRLSMTRVFNFKEMYENILNIPGVIMEFGVQWGRDLTTLINLRGYYEPYNYTRKIIGFDTFEGLKGISDKDNKNKIKENDYTVSENFESYLSEVLDLHEQLSPLSHIKKTEIIKGNIEDTLPKYLEEHTETIISFVYFDMNIYKPTKRALELIKPYLIKGSVIGFNDLNHPSIKGETLALREVFGLNNLKIIKSKNDSIPSYMIFEG